jgi:hypothetical protein
MVMNLRVNIPCLVESISFRQMFSTVKAESGSRPTIIYTFIYLFIVIIYLFIGAYLFIYRLLVRLFAYCLIIYFLLLVYLCICSQIFSYLCSCISSDNAFIYKSN